MKSWLKKHINSILITILVHLLIVFVGLATHLSTEIVHKETPLIIDPNILTDEVEEPDDIDESNLENLISDLDVENFLNNLTTSRTNYTGAKDNLRDNKELDLDDIRKMYEEEILREKYGDDYNNRNDNISDNYEDYNYNTNQNRNNKPSHQVDNTNKPCLVEVILSDKNRAIRYLHIPVFTCRGSGRIEIGINISQEGKVISTKLLNIQADSDKDCLTEAAISAAKKSRFAIIDSRTTQTGKIIYTFMTQ
ncbi:MAG: hypothetical protein GX879_10620 [Bacteroidales bacterium]|nr:hypothetical protein [Bacteroidales bacterium]